jgi:hypothetical protein
MVARTGATAKMIMYDFFKEMLRRFLGIFRVDFFGAGDVILCVFERVIL